MAQAPAQIALLLLGAVAFDRLGLSSAILPPVVGVFSAPLARAVETDLPIHGIGGQVPLTSLRAALLLAGLGRAGSLRGVKSGGGELLLAEAANALIHPVNL